MKTLTILSAAAAMLSMAAAQNQTFAQTFDDTDPLIDYSSGWEQQAGLNGPTDGTQSYSASPTASYSFTFAGTGFSICAGKKIDRGTFSVTIDDVLAGTGNQTSDSLNNSPPCETVFQVENLSPSGHTVVVTNTGSGRSPFLTLDAITLDVLVPNASSSASAASAASTSSTSASSSSSQPSSTVVSGAGASAAAQSNSGGGSSTAAIAGGVVAGIVVIALAAILWFCCAKRRRRRQAVAQEDETRSNPFTDGDQGSNRAMSQLGGSPVLFESTMTQPDQATGAYAGAPDPPPAIPYAGAYHSPESSSTPIFDNRYSIMSAAAGGVAPAPSQRTSYASPAPQLPVIASDRSPSPFAPFASDAQEPLDEDPYGGMESEDESANQHSRRPSQADIVASRKGSHSLKRKPVPEA